MSNTFFISPLIPLKFYIMIQKEKANPSLNWNQDEINFIKNINILFDYDNELSENNKTIVSNIINKITNNRWKVQIKKIIKDIMIYNPNNELLIKKLNKIYK